MKAIGYTESLPIDNDASLIDVIIDEPTPSGRDLKVKVKAVAVNPVDFKIRQNVSPETGTTKILGWDAVGEVVEVGDQASLFAPGDSVYYAGDLTRQGTNAQYHVVDERIVGKKPQSLSDAQAAALPLTTITAWELLFEHLALTQDESAEQVLLIVGASGGVGSIMVQLAATLTSATIIATASRDSSRDWVKSLGAHHVIDHSQPMTEQIEALGVGPVTHVASLTHTDSYLDTYVEVLKPMGKIALIDDPENLDIRLLKPKSISLHWEFMFTRSMFQTTDMLAQHTLLNEVSRLIDDGKLKTTFGQHLGKINAANLRKAHAILESGKSIGKLVLEGFE